MWCLAVLNNTDTLSVQTHTNTSNDTHAHLLPSSLHYTAKHRHCQYKKNTKLLPQILHYTAKHRHSVSTKSHTHTYYNQHYITPLNTEGLSVQTCTHTYYHKHCITTLNTDTLSVQTHLLPLTLHYTAKH